MEMYKFRSREEYMVVDKKETILEVEYQLAAYNDGETEMDRELFFINAQKNNFFVRREGQGQPSIVSSTGKVDDLDDKVFAAINTLPEYVRTPINKAFGRSK